MDYGQRATEAELARVRGKLDTIYRQAYREIAEKGEGFLKRYAEKAEELRKQLEEGKITRADYEAWMRGQVFQGKQWAARLDSMQQTLYNADRTAQDIVNGARYDVFAANANYIGYTLEHDGDANIGFSLYDANTVARLVRDDPDLLPPKGVGKNASYQWYNRTINSAITQGILQGEGVADIAKRIGKLTGEKSESAMLRNARTMFTGAQNAGRIEGMHQAQALGVKVQKRWLATLDSRTRDAHADLDGQVRDVDEPFDSELGPIDFPGDPTADPANVYNCRCTLEYVYPDYESSALRRDNENGEVIGDMTYREWEQMKRERGQRGA